MQVKAKCNCIEVKVGACRVSAGPTRLGVFNGKVMKGRDAVLRWERGMAWLNCGRDPDDLIFTIRYTIYTTKGVSQKSHEHSRPILRPCTVCSRREL